MKNLIDELNSKVKDCLNTSTIFNTRKYVLLDDAEKILKQALNITDVSSSLFLDKEIEETIWEEISIPLCETDRIEQTDNYTTYLNAVHWAKWMRDLLKGNETN